jgi:hypothetical protein
MSERDPAAARFAVTQAARLASVALVLVGILINVGRLAILPPAAGIILIVAGLAGTFVVPLLLARRWRTPPK